MRIQPIGTHIRPNTSTERRFGMDEEGHSYVVATCVSNMNCRRLQLVVVVLIILAAVPPVAAQESNLTTITVEVIDEEREPIQGVTVIAEWGADSVSADTASNGMVLVDVPRGEQIEITINHPDYVRNFPYVIDNADQQRIELDVSERSSLSVGVDTNSGPIADARVTLTMDDRTVASGNTSQEGIFSVETLEAGEYTLTAEKRTYYTINRTIEVDGETNINLNLNTGGVTTEFIIVDPHFSPPESVSGATVSISGIGDVQTLGDGRAVARIPINTEVPVTVTKPKYEDIKRTLMINESGQTRTYELTRRPQLNITTASDRIIAGESVSIEVTNAYEEPAPDVIITRNAESVGQTNENGELTVSIPNAESYSLIASQDSIESEPVSVRGVNVVGSTPEPTSTTTPTPSAPSLIPDIMNAGALPIIGVIATISVIIALIVAGIFTFRR